MFENSYCSVVETREGERLNEGVENLPQSSQTFSVVDPLEGGGVHILHSFSNFFIFPKYSTAHMQVSSPLDGHISFLFSWKPNGGQRQAFNTNCEARRVCGKPRSHR